MKIKRFVTAVTIFMAILAVGSCVWAYDYSNHVSVAPNGKGDVLIYPAFIAAQGWENRITVVNTSGKSVVAKLIVRSQVYSDELLDFLLFLSPYDMWIGTIRYGASGPEMYSTDSSALYTDISNSAPFATEITPLQRALASTPCSNDTNVFGYVEVIEAWSGVVTFTKGTTDKQQRGKDIYNTYMAVGSYTTASTENVLAGSFDIEVPQYGLTSSEQAVVLKNYKNLNALVPSILTYLGDTADNTVEEIDAALSKNKIAVPFVNGAEGISFPFFTFPTKMSSHVYDTIDPTKCIYTGSRSKYFSAQKVNFTLNAYDNEEQTTAGSPFSPAQNLSFPYEVNVLPINNLVFTKGWFQVTLPNPAAAGVTASGAPLNYTGAPVIPIVFDVRSGLSLKYVAYDNGTVTGGTTTLPDYHYAVGYAQSN